ncbi:MAG: AccB [Clostridiales bacterium]|jgi:biotin carboxyl carrier protein|nr:AccB [Clostridiales bacterium]
MKKYIVTINEKKYEVEVEEVGASTPPMEKVIETKVSNNEIKKEEINREAPISKPAEGKNTIKAPMPGAILDVRISKGQNIKKGDVMFILEAMKMENEIMAGEDGTVFEVVVTKGTTVNTDDVLAILE